MLGMLDGELAFPAPPGDSEVAEIAAATVVDVLVPRGQDSPGFEEHDGLFFRVSFGGGYGSRTSPVATGDVTLNTGGTHLSGLGIALRVSVPIPVDETTSLRLTESVGFGVAAALSATFN